MKITKEKLQQIIKEELDNIVEQTLELSPKEKGEAKALLNLKGYSLEERIKMVMGMGAGQVYNKIAGAFLGGVFGEEGVAKGKEMLQIVPDIEPVEGNWAQDSDEEQVELETGNFLEQSEWDSIKNLVDILDKGGNKSDVARVIESAAKRQNDPRTYIIKLRDLFGRLRQFGSVEDKTRGVSLSRGGAAKAQKQGFVELPNGEKFPAKEGTPWIQRFNGTRKYGYDLADALKYINPESLREHKMKITKAKLQQIIKEEYQRALSEIDPERHGMGRTYSAYEIPDDFEQDLYPGADDELSFEDRNRFVKAYNMIADAVETGQLPESVEDAVFDMLNKLGIYL
jgi:hypothetical protein